MKMDAGNIEYAFSEAKHPVAFDDLDPGIAGNVFDYNFTSFLMACRSPV